MIERLEAEGGIDDPGGRIDQLRKLRADVLSEEKNLKLLIQDYEQAQIRDPQQAERIERTQSALRRRVDRALEAIVGTELTARFQGRERREIGENHGAWSLSRSRP